MHNEKPTYRTEDGDNESSSTSSSRSSFGSGPAFRPVIPVEGRPVHSVPEVPAAPRRVGLEGVLFDRHRVISHLDETEKARKKAKSKEEGSDENDGTSTETKSSATQTTEAVPSPRTQAPEAASLHTVAAETTTDTEPSEAEQPEFIPDSHVTVNGSAESIDVFSYPEMPVPSQHAESSLPPLGDVRVPEQYSYAPGDQTTEADPIAGHVPPTSTHHSLVPPRQPITQPFEQAAFGPVFSGSTEAAPEGAIHDEDETPAPMPTPPANPAPSYNTAPSPTAAAYYNQVGNTPPPITSTGGNTLPPMGPPPTSNFGAAPNMYPPVPNPNNPNTYPSYGSGGGQAASPNIAPVAPNQAIEQRQKGNPWPYVAVLAERFARRRADKKLEGRLGNRIDGQAKSQESMQATQRSMQRQQEQMSAFQSRQEADARRNRTAETWGTAAAVTAVAGSGESVRLATTHGQQGELHPMTPIQNTSERQLLESAEPIELAPHQHVEHSAWHNIVVNERGQEVTGAINYGEGFKRERQQEIIPDRMAAGAVPGSGGGAAGGSGVGPSPYGQTGQPYGYQQDGMHQQALPSGMTSPSLPQGQPTHVDPQHQLPEHTQKRTNTVMPGPVFWVMALLIILAFFAAALI